MSRKLSDLKEPARSRAEAALADLKASGVSCVVTSTLRTVEEQVALYAQGRETLEAVNKKREAASLGPIHEKKISIRAPTATGSASVKASPGEARTSLASRSTSSRS